MNRLCTLPFLLVAILALPIGGGAARRPPKPPPPTVRSLSYWLAEAGQNWARGAGDAGAAGQLTRALREAVEVARGEAEKAYLGRLAVSPLDPGAAAEWGETQGEEPPPLLLLAQGEVREAWLLGAAPGEALLVPGLAAAALAIGRTAPAPFLLSPPPSSSTLRVLPAQGLRHLAPAGLVPGEALMVSLPASSSGKGGAICWVLTDRLRESFQKKIEPLAGRGLAEPWRTWAHHAAAVQVGLWRRWLLTLALGSQTRFPQVLPSPELQLPLATICSARASALVLWGAIQPEAVAAFLDYGFLAAGWEMTLPAPFPLLVSWQCRQGWLSAGTALLLEGVIAGTGDAERNGRRLLLWHLIRSGAVLSAEGGRATLSSQLLAPSLNSFLEQTGGLLAIPGQASWTSFLAGLELPPPLVLTLRALLAFPPDG